ncbi:MAG TPA: hypothetical protein VN224_11990, partial [Xanthomonadales bacterium]|nr:hypothetical protein [Xanthomonadales bacterium]
TMHQATDAALQGAALAAQTKGRSGSVEPLAAFEKVAKDHEARTAALQKRLAAISEKMSAGSIKTVGFGPALRDMFARLNTPIVAPAEAALAIPALAACIAQNWVLCAVQIAKSIPAAINAWSAYKSCMSNVPSVPSKPSPPSSKPWWSYPGRYAQYLVQLAIYNVALFKHNNYQTGCVVIFVAKIA